MNIFIKTISVALLLSLSACSQSSIDPEQEKERILNAPRNRKEAAIIMQSIDMESETNEWNHNATREFRQRMKSRLISAGLKEDEIDKWTES